MVNRPFRIHQQIHIAPPCCIIQPRTEEPYPSIGTDQFMGNQANGVELAASLSARISRCLQGRKVDVLIAAPNLAVLPIHTVAREEGQAL